jgi:hypothetical protein
VSCRSKPKRLTGFSDAVDRSLDHCLFLYTTRSKSRSSRMGDEVAFCCERSIGLWDFEYKLKSEACRNADAVSSKGRFIAAPKRYCLMLASSLPSSAVAGSNLPPRYFARNSSVAALKAMLLVGRAKPCPSSGKT